MAKQANIQGAVDKLRTENKKQFVELNENQEKTAVATEKTARLINDMLEAMALERQRNQDKEEKDAKKGGMSGGTGSGSDKKKKDEDGLGLPLGLVGGIGLGGLLSGLMDGYRRILTGANQSVDPKGNTAKNTSKQTKTFKENLKGIGDRFKSINTSLNDIRTKTLNKIETGIKSFKTEAGKLGNRFTNFSTSLQNIKPPSIVPEGSLKTPTTAPKVDVDPKESTRLSQAVDKFKKAVNFKSLTDLLESVSEKMPKKEFFDDIKTKVSTKIDGMRTAISPLVDRMEELRSNIATKASEKIQGAKTSVSTGVDNLKNSKFVQSLKNINTETKPIKAVLDPIKDTIDKIKLKWDDIGKSLGKILSKTAAVGKALAWPLQAIVGIVTGYNGIEDNLEQHKDLINNDPEKYFAGTMGAIEGAINGIVMAPLDLLKDASEWLFDKVFAYDRNPDGTIKDGQGLPSWAIKKIEAFDFTDMTSSLFDGVTKSVLQISNYISDRISDPKKLEQDLVNLKDKSKDVAQGLWDATTGAVERMFDKLETAIDEKFKNVTNMFDGLGDVAGNIRTNMKEFFVGLLPDPNSFFGNFIPDSVYQWGGIPVPERDVYTGRNNRNKGVGDGIKIDPELQAQIDRSNELPNYAITGLEFRDSKQRKFDKTQEFFKNNPQALANFIAANMDEETGELEVNLKNVLRSKQMNAEDKAFLRQKKSELDRLINEGGSEEEIQFIKATILGILRKGFNDLQRGYVDPYHQSGITTDSKSLVVNAGDKGKQLLAQQSMNAALNGANTSIVVAPSTNVVNNNSSQGIIMTKNMPAVDPLDQSYGVA